MNVRRGFRCLLLLSVLSFHSSSATSSDAASATVEGVPLGSISMQFQSESAAPNIAAFLQDLNFTTSNYLNEYFTVYYSNGFQLVTLQIQSDQVETSSNGYGTYAAQVTLNGTAEFSANSLPTQDQVSNLLAYAFQQQNRQLYVDKLLASSDAYLQHLTYFVVSINGFVISDGQQNGVVQNPAASNSGGRHVDWERVVIIACSVAGGLLVLACCVMVVFCCWTTTKDASSQLDDDNDTCEHGVIGGPGPLTLSPRTMNYHHKKQPEGKNEHFEAGSTRSPSPVRSLVSQDSSAFTYNPRSKASLETRNTMSMIQIDISHSSIDIEAWKNHNNMISPVTPAPFGADLSAIECSMPQKKDLSLIDEDDLKEVRLLTILYIKPNCDVSAVKCLTISVLSIYLPSQNDGPSPHVVASTANYLTKGSLLDQNTRKLEPPAATSSMFRSNGAMSPNHDLFDDEISTAHSDDSDVIRDLDKLSKQFDKYRGL
jgi:hypothetical protein